jgi:putative AlgH/UPF0301 family transcriptional regulator
MNEEWTDKNWFFCDEDGKVIFIVNVSHSYKHTPPAELIEMIELYSKGYRVKK